MQRTRTTIVHYVVFSLLVVSLTACKKNDEEPAPKFNPLKPLIKFGVSLLAPLRPEQPDTIAQLEKQAERFLARNKPDLAEKQYKLALTIRQSGWGAEHANVIPGLEKLAVFYTTQNQFTAAEPLFHRAVALREKLQGVNHPDIALTLEPYAAFLRQARRDAEAAAIERRIQVLRGSNPSLTQR